jgi:hypothetical protein
LAFAPDRPARQLEQLPTHEAAMVVPWHAPALVARAVDQVVRDPRFLGATAALVAVLLFGALLLSLFERWWKRPPADRPSPADELAHFRQLYERGQLSPEEYERIRRLLDEPRPPPSPAQTQSPQPPGPNGPAAAPG